MNVYFIKRLKYFQYVKNKRKENRDGVLNISEEGIGSLHSYFFLYDQIDHESHSIDEKANMEIQMDPRSGLLTFNNHLEEEGKPLRMVVGSKSLFPSVAPIQHETMTGRVSSVNVNSEPCDQCDKVSIASDIEEHRHSAIPSELQGRDENKQKNAFTKYHSEKNDNGGGGEIGRLETRSDLELEGKEDIQEGENKEKEDRDDDNDNDNDKNSDKNENTDEKESTENDDDDKLQNNTQIKETTMEEEQFTSLETITQSEPERDKSKSLLAKIRSISPAHLRSK